MARRAGCAIVVVVGSVRTDTFLSRRGIDLLGIAFHAWVMLVRKGPAIFCPLLRGLFLCLIELGHLRVVEHDGFVGDGANVHGPVLFSLVERFRRLVMDPLHEVLVDL